MRYTFLFQSRGVTPLSALGNTSMSGRSVWSLKVHDVVTLRRFVLMPLRG